MPYPQFERQLLKIKPLSERYNKVYIERDYVRSDTPVPNDCGIDESLMDEVVERIRQARANGRPVMMAFGAHSIKNGLGPLMVDLMEPAPDEVICDPACGTSGFLVAASEYLKENRKEDVFFNRKNKDHYMNHMFHGFDMDRTMLRIGAMNMMTHGVDNPFIEYCSDVENRRSLRLHRTGRGLVRIIYGS